MLNGKYIVCPHCGAKIRDVDFSIQEQDMRCPECALHFYLFRENDWLAIQFKAPVSAGKVPAGA